MWVPAVNKCPHWGVYTGCKVCDEVGLAWSAQASSLIIVTQESGHTHLRRICNYNATFMHLPFNARQPPIQFINKQCSDNGTLTFDIDCKHICPHNHEHFCWILISNKKNMPWVSHSIRWKKNHACKRYKKKGNVESILRCKQVRNMVVQGLQKPNSLTSITYPWLEFPKFGRQ